MRYRDGYDHMDGSWEWLMMGAVWLLVIGLLVVIAIVVVQGLQRRPPHSAAVRPAADALAILEVRLARGEIDVATYDELRSRLAASG